MASRPSAGDRDTFHDQTKVLPAEKKRGVGKGQAFNSTCPKGPSSRDPGGLCAVGDPEAPSEGGCGREGLWHWAPMVFASGSTEGLSAGCGDVLTP